MSRMARQTSPSNVKFFVARLEREVAQAIASEMPADWVERLEMRLAGLKGTN